MNGVQKIAKERNMTAREAGKKIGRSPRTVRRLVALDREDYLQRAAEKRQKVWDMRALGYSWDEIAEVVDSTAGGARSLWYQHLKHQKQKEKQEKQRDTATIDMFE